MHDERLACDSRPGGERSAHNPQIQETPYEKVPLGGGVVSSCSQRY